MAVTISKYNNVGKDLIESLDLAADTIKVVLVNGYAFSAAHSRRNQITNEVANGNGYTTGGATLASKTVSAAGVFDAADVVWPNSTIGATGAIITKVTGTAANDPLIAYVDFGETKNSDNGNFSIVWNASGILSVS